MSELPINSLIKLICISNSSLNNIMSMVMRNITLLKITFDILSLIKFLLLIFMFN